MEQKLPNCEVTQLPSWERTMKSPGFLILRSLSLSLSLSPAAASHLLHMTLPALCGGQKQG